MPNSFLRISALKGPTPFKYSIGLSNMEGVDCMVALYAKINDARGE
jgi:hypothetical protein